MNIQSDQHPKAEQPMATNLSAPAQHQPSPDEGFSPNDLCAITDRGAGAIIPIRRNARARKAVPSHRAK